MTALDANYFDGWYADKLAAEVLAAAKQRHLGHSAELVATSLQTVDGLREVSDSLQLSKGKRLLDLACGAGAFGCWVAARTGCDVLGVDFSAVAVAHAQTAAANTFGLTGERAQFSVGELTATGFARRVGRRRHGDRHDSARARTRGCR